MFPLVCLWFESWRGKKFCQVNLFNILNLINKRNKEIQEKNIFTFSGQFFLSNVLILFVENVSEWTEWERCCRHKNVDASEKTKWNKKKWNKKINHYRIIYFHIYVFSFRKKKSFFFTDKYETSEKEIQEKLIFVKLFLYILFPEKFQ